MSVVSATSSKASMLSIQCCGTTKSGEPCKRTHKFAEDACPETWTCWQHVMNLTVEIPHKSDNEDVTPPPSRSGSPAPAAPAAPEPPTTPDRPITKTEPKTPRKPRTKKLVKETVEEPVQPLDLLDALNQAS